MTFIVINIIVEPYLSSIKYFFAYSVTFWHKIQDLYKKMCFYHFSVETLIRATRLVIFMTFWTTFIFVNILNLCPDGLSELKKSIKPMLSEGFRKKF